MAAGAAGAWGEGLAKPGLAQQYLGQVYARGSCRLDKSSQSSEQSRRRNCVAREKPAIGSMSTLSFQILSLERPSGNRAFGFFE